MSTQLIDRDMLLRRERRELARIRTLKQDYAKRLSDLCRREREQLETMRRLEESATMPANP